MRIRDTPSARSAQRAAEKLFGPLGWVVRGFVGIIPKLGGGTPKWMVYFMEKPMNKWMIWGYHHFLETPN